jgi:hypothetical protein
LIVIVALPVTASAALASAGSLTAMRPIVVWVSLSVRAAPM